MRKILFCTLLLSAIILSACASGKPITQIVIQTQTVTETQTVTSPTKTITVTPPPIIVIGTPQPTTPPTTTTTTTPPATTTTITPPTTTTTTTPPATTTTTTPPTTTPPPITESITPTTVEDLKDAIFEEVNRIRVDHGLPALIRDPYLDTIADDHAFTMMVMGYISHWGFEDRASTIFNEMPFVTEVGENVAYVNVISYDAVGRYFAEAWYESLEHRENMLNPIYKRTGIGLQVLWENLEIPNYYAVQIFTD